MLTLPSEVKYIWQGEILKLSTLLYILCRYALLGNVLYIMAIDNKRVRPVHVYGECSPGLTSRALVRQHLPSPNLVFQSPWSSRCDIYYKFVGILSILGRTAVICEPVRR